MSERTFLRILEHRRKFYRNVTFSLANCIERLTVLILRFTLFNKFGLAHEVFAMNLNRKTRFLSFTPVFLDFHPFFLVSTRFSTRFLHSIFSFPNSYIPGNNAFPMPIFPLPALGNTVDKPPLKFASRITGAVLGIITC